MHRSFRKSAIALALGFSAALASAAPDSTAPEAKTSERDWSADRLVPDEARLARFGMTESATADVQPTIHGDVSGTVQFLPSDDYRYMLVIVKLDGLDSGAHGFHVHAVGDCSADDASSAGGHFNPYNVKHGSPDDPVHHLGDLGNIQPDSSGRVETVINSEQLGFNGPVSVLQKAVVVHAGADDLKTDPAGNAGKRIGCGVIRADTEVLADDPV
tara:strand:- start:83576 stop:84220 length:645 start_codon:yes stop_codon:yes gene_type:complete